MGAVVGAGASPPLPSSLAGRLREARALLLPYGYPSTVASSYAAYAGLAFCGSVFSSAAGVLSTQSLLLAVGVGAGAVPLAAALNWVLKDGLGQLGGVLAAALIRNRFDSDPKRWRLAAAVAQDAASLLEIATPLLPGAFLPLAAAANVGKNVAWLSASATRASLHSALALRGNLADVTAKAGSQSMAGSTLGMLLGIALSPAVGAAPAHVFAAFAACSAAHLACVHASLRALVLPTLSPQRLALAAAPALASPRAPVRTPEQVCTREDFVWRRAGDAALALVDVGPPLDGWRADALQHFALATRTPASRFLVAVRRAAAGSESASAGVAGAGEAGAGGAEPRVHLWYAADASWRDVVLGFVHALHVARQLVAQAESSARASMPAPAPAPASDGAREEADVGLVADGALFLDANGDELLADLERAGWWVGQPILEPEHGRRLHFC